MAPRARLADLITITGGISGFLAVVVVGGLWPGLSALPDGLSDDILVASLLLYAISMTCDVLDGPIARRFGSSGLGATLDTMCDTISFGLLPGMLLVARFQGESALAILVLAAAALYVGATIFRLARQAALEATCHATSVDPGAAPRGAFSGMPSPVGGNCLLALVVLNPPAWLAVVVAVAVAYLLVADFPYPNNASVGGIFVGALLALSFLAIAGLLSLQIPAGLALVGLLPVAVFNASRSALAR